MSAAGFFAKVKDSASEEVLTAIAADVEAVENQLNQMVKSDQDLVQKVAQHTLEAGGKRLRPAFLSLAAKATGRPFDPVRAHRLGACLEMIHMATLIHDDVVDHASQRRGRPTAAVIYGNTASILSGDVLLAKAMVVLAKDGDLEIIRTVSGSVVEIAEGEVRELESRGEFELDEVEHLSILRMKTASFIECCCRVGALVASASPEEQTHLASYGHHIGMAFQIADDLLDFRGDLAMTGKPLATDFREGCATLPLIYLRPSLTDEELSFTARKFGNGVTDDEIRMICGWMEARGAYEQAQNKARVEADAALSSLGRLPRTVEGELLRSVAEFVVSRDS